MREMNKEKVSVAGYVKLAKLWEKNRDKAVEYHHKYYKDKYADDDSVELYDVYIDITGQKNIRKRPEMIRLLKDCTKGKIDIILTQTRAYLAANNAEFCLLLYYLFNLSHRVEIVTEDEYLNINTIKNEENQRDALIKMASDYVKVFPKDYEKWIKDITDAMEACKN